ncbi:carboxylating nicotinate-nucleotide diphosphorylase [Hyphococcus sp.]|uniref:carboxylating nicotinate-nucleotide diphosphorylase n=1 Tax=Hyphococcus sp. TaxID=2038636 RepID=UPI003CCBF38A
MNLTSPPQHIIEAAIKQALAEDLGDAGDITTNACIPHDAVTTASIVARKAGVISGAPLAKSAFHLNGVDSFHVEKNDSEAVAPGDVIATIEGPARGILTAERVALNFLGHLSGVATATSALVKAVEGTNAKIVCTRKTTPGLRALEKYAVRCGGGHNHRFGLYDAVMIKDNHIAAVGGIKKAIEACRAAVGHMVKIEVEIDGLDQLDAALSGGADIIMLDNMAPDDMKKAVAEVKGRAVLEASGNVTVQTVRAIAQTGVDIISSGWITHSAPGLDVGLDFH